MIDNKYEELKSINYYQEVINNLRSEISKLIKENEMLKERIIDLEIISEGHKELVGNLIKENEKLTNGRNK